MDELEAEGWWIDYLENEVDPILQHELDVLLQQSEEDQFTYLSYQLIRHWVKSSDPDQDLLPPAEVAEALEANLHDRIMEAVGKIKPTTPRKSGGRPTTTKGCLSLVP